MRRIKPQNKKLLLAKIEANGGLKESTVENPEFPAIREQWANAVTWGQRYEAGKLLEKLGIFFDCLGAHDVKKVSLAHLFFTYHKADWSTDDAIFREICDRGYLRAFNVYQKMRHLSPYAFFMAILYQVEGYIDHMEQLVNNAPDSYFLHIEQRWYTKNHPEKFRDDFQNERKTLNSYSNKVTGFLREAATWEHGLSESEYQSFCLKIRTRLTTLQQKYHADQAGALKEFYKHHSRDPHEFSHIDPY